MSDMKLIMENWRKFSESEEEINEVDFSLFIENKLVERDAKMALLQEGEMVWNDEGFRLQTDFAKWAAISGMSTTACAAAITIASMFAGWEGVLIVLGPALISLAFNPIIMAMATFAAFKFRPTRKLLIWILKKMGGKTLKKIEDGVARIVDKMVESSKGELSKEKAIELYALIAEYIFKSKEFRDNLKHLFHALRGEDQIQVALLSAKLDDIVEKLIRKNILGISEEDVADQTVAPSDVEFEFPTIDVSEEEPRISTT